MLGHRWQGPGLWASGAGTSPHNLLNPQVGMRACRPNNIHVTVCRVEGKEGGGASLKSACAQDV
jgi:hypothetical protein